MVGWRIVRPCVGLVPVVLGQDLPADPAVAVAVAVAVPDPVRRDPDRWNGERPRVIVRSEVGTETPDLHLNRSTL